MGVSGIAAVQECAHLQAGQRQVLSGSGASDSVVKQVPSERSF